MSPRQVDQRSVRALAKRNGRALGELALGGRSPGDHDPGRCGMEGGKDDAYAQSRVTESP